MGISLVSTVRTDAATLHAFVAYHLNLGSKRVYLFFDDPNDSALAELEEVPGVRAVRCDESYWAGARPSTIELRQVSNAVLAMRWARQEGMDWIAHVDSDELIYAPDGQLPTLLAGTEASIDALAFLTLEGIPDPHAVRPFTDTQLFRSSVTALPFGNNVARLLGQRPLRYGTFRGHAGGKSIMRTQSAAPGPGVHRPLKSPDQEAQVRVSHDAFILHFDCCTFEDWLVKWGRRYDGTAAASNMRSTRKRQYRGYVSALRSGSEAPLRREYERQCRLSGIERSGLKAMGLLRHIALDPGLFEAEPTA